MQSVGRADATAAAGAPPSASSVTQHLPLTASVGLNLMSIALSGTIVGTLDPTLQWRLSAAPFQFDSDAISLFFFYSSVVYVLTSTPTGRLVDQMAPSSRLYKSITAAGFLILFVTFALLGPLGPRAFGPKGEGDEVRADGLESSLNNLPCTAIAIGIKGIGSAWSNVAIYPDLVLNLPDSPLLQATVTAWWNAAYAIGWAAGPIMGGVLYDTFAYNKLCLDKDKYCPADHDDVLATEVAASQAQARVRVRAHNASLAPPPLSPPSPPPMECSCDWMPANGFDGFSTVTACVALGYTLVLGAAILCNVRNPPARQPGLTSSTSVAPLRAAAIE